MNEKEILLERAKRCFKQACEAEANQREREREDLRFQVPEEQWDDNARRQRAGDGITPARPILSISKLDQPIQLVHNQARQAKLGVNVHPVSENADDDTAEVIQGIYRRIERDSNADQARLWALDRAVKAGRGAYRVNTKWDEDSDPKNFDQEIVIERILHQDAVYFDPSAQKPDYSDGEWAFVTSWVPIETFRRKWPNARPAVAGTMEFMNMASETPEWVNVQNGKQAVLVAEYWYKEHDTQTVEPPKGAKRAPRERDIVSVKFCRLTGFEVLEEQDWDGKYIPLVPVIGRELQPFDAERRFVGMIGPSRDGQRLYNFAASTLVERMAMEPKTPFVGYVGQFATDEAKWKQINIRNFAYVESDVVTVDGKPAPLPQRAQLDQTGMSIAMMALQEADNFIQSTTSVYDPSLGRSNPRDESGRAKLALQSQSDAATGHYLASLADVSMNLEARIILDLMPKVYDRPARITKILGGEDETKTVMLNAPFVVDPNGGRPRRVQEGHEGAKLYDFRNGGYSVSVSIGKSFQTRLQEGGEMIGQILQAQPELMSLVGPTYFRFQDWPGAEELADILKKLRDKQFPGLGDDQDGQTAEQAQVKVQALEQQLQMLQQQLGEAAKIIQTDQVKQQAHVQSEQIKSTAQVEIARMNNATKVLVARITAAKEAANAMKEDEEEAIALALTQEHEKDMQKFDAAHEVGMAAAGGNTLTMRREGGQETGRERESESTQGQSNENTTEHSTAPEAEA
jgi:hypothetical protein